MACRSIASSNACRSSGFSSSLWLASCCGLELMMKSSNATPGLDRTTKCAALRVATEVGGTTSTPSSWLLFSAVIIASVVWKNCRPNPSMCGLGP